MLTRYLLFIVLSAQGQNINTSYFDEYGHLTYIETAHHYRRNTDTIDFYRSYYKETNNAFFEGYIIDAVDSVDYNNKYFGHCKWYHKNGKVKADATYNRSGFLDGMKQEYSENGLLIKQSSYTNNVLTPDKYLEIDENGIQRIVFEEDFKNNFRNWKLAINELTSCKIKLGGLEILNKMKQNYAVFTNERIDSLNFSIEAKINSNYLTPDSKCGFVFDFKNWNNYSYFYISKFRFHTGYIKNGIIIENIDNYFSVNLNGYAWNNLKILCVNDSVSFYINNSIQCSSQRRKTGDELIGLNVYNGNALFDNLLIKQYSRSFSNICIINNESLVNWHYDLPVRGLYEGVILGKNGYILTSIKNVEQVNRYIVELNYNNSVKRCEADVFFSNPISKLLVLKVRNEKINDSIDIAYSYDYMKNFSNEKPAISFCANNKSGASNLKPLAISSMKINIHSHPFQDQYNSHSCIGGPLFSPEGDLLGVITDVDKQNEVKSLNLQEINNYLFSNSKILEIKSKNKVDTSIFKQNIITNIVVIKTF